MYINNANKSLSTFCLYKSFKKVINGIVNLFKIQVLNDSTKRSTLEKKVEQIDIRTRYFWVF